MCADPAVLMICHRAIHESVTQFVLVELGVVHAVGVGVFATTLAAGSTFHRHKVHEDQRSFLSVLRVTPTTTCSRRHRTELILNKLYIEDSHHTQVEL